MCRKLIVGLLALTSLAAVASPPNLVPWPKSVTMGQGGMVLMPTARLVAQDPSLAPLASVVSEEIYRTHWIRLKTEGGGAGPGDIGLEVDRKLRDEQYVLTVTDRVVVRGGSYRAVAWGTVTLLQALEEEGGAVRLPQMKVADEPAVEYRGLLIDCARQWHPAKGLKDIIVMCRLYKINYIQLHLTDNESFTFPSTAFPSLPTVEKGERRHYTREELLDVVKFADERGVTLVPEVETPGHSGRLRQIEPFGREGLGCINMANEKTYEAFDTLIGELCDVFKSSPFIHIGTDESSLGGAGSLPEEKAYMQAHGLKNTKDLFNHHIVRLDQIIKKHGKKTMRWGGFSDSDVSVVKLPHDIITMVWQVRGNHVITKEDHPVINAAWKPLYVVNSKAWLPSYLIDTWHIRLWQFHMESATGTTLMADQPVFGAQMCAWEQPAEAELPSLRWRLPAMGERIYNPDSKRPYTDYARRFERTDPLLDNLLCPVQFEFKGLSGDPADMAFTDAVTITLSSMPGSAIRYTLDGSEPTAVSSLYQQPLTIRAADVKQDSYCYSRAHGRFLRETPRLHVRVACYDAAGRLVGQSLEKVLYAIKPMVRARIYYSPKMFDHTREDWKEAKDWERMGIKPDREAVWPNLVFSMPSSHRGAVFVPVCSGVITRGRISIPAEATYAFLYADNGGEVYVDGKLVTKSNDAMLKPVTLKAGLHELEVRYAHTHLFHTGTQALLYAVIKDGQSMDGLLDPPKSKEKWGRPKKGCWQDHEGLLVPLDEKVSDGVSRK